jgi:thioredoxin 1
LLVSDSLGSLLSLFSMKYCSILLFSLMVLITACATAPPYDGPGTFDKTADAKAQLSRSLSSVQKSGKHVLLIYGANWCSDSTRTVALLKSDPEISRILRDSYLVTRIDVGPSGSGRNGDLVARYHATIKKGIPVLVVLDGSGRFLNDTRQTRLRDSDHEHPDRIADFLQQHAPSSSR